MKTLSINVYPVNELPEDIKTKVLNKYRYINTEDSYWYEPTIEDWKNELHKQGFPNAEIHFSGFHSQGDGACFDADIDVKHFGLRFSELLNEYACFRIEKTRQSSYYFHKNTRYTAYYSTRKNNIDTYLKGLNESIESVRVELCKKIYSDLENQYNYLTSDEQVIEFLTENDYYFTENGTLIP